MLPFVISLPLLYPKTVGNGCAQYKSPSLLGKFSLIYYGLWHKHNPPENSNHMLACITLSLYNVDFVLFHNVTCYINSLWSCIHINIVYFLNLMCTLVATYVILERLECNINVVARVISGQVLWCQNKYSIRGYSPFPTLIGLSRVT
jgi:hypothetical protein